jgi:tRNA (guanine37-N1)-methyltransferase
MKIDIITIFPGMIEPMLEFGILGKAHKCGQVEIRLVDLRNFTVDRHRTVDDRPFGGGEGMVFKPEPLAAAIRSLKTGGPGERVVFLSPQGRLLTQRRVRELAGWDHLILICGRYEGIDQRVIDLLVDEQVSIGDYVLSGGELPAMVLADAIARLAPGVVGHPDSTRNESFEADLLDCPVYTRPEIFEGLAVPEVLMSGNHERIRLWRAEQALANTRRHRPDLLEKPLSRNDIEENSHE